MNRAELEKNLFWGKRSPLTTLTGVGILIIASGRTAYALVTLGALVWVYTLTALIFCFTKPFFPVKGKDFVVISLASVLAGIYLLFISLLSPLLALETSLYIILTPMYCFSMKLFPRLEHHKTEDVVVIALLESLIFGIFLLALSLIREPLGYGSLSLPGGGSEGIIEFFTIEDDAVFPVRIFTGSAGALILLGYGVAFFNYIRDRKAREDDES
jgi:hypothetical protein